MTKHYKSDILAMVHEDAAANFEIGAISEAEMREFDEDCLVSGPKTPKRAPAAARQAPASVYAGPRKG
jgi:DNA-binding transcriptional regulator YiaG